MVLILFSQKRLLFNVEIQWPFNILVDLHIVDAHVSGKWGTSLLWLFTIGCLLRWVCCISIQHNNNYLHVVCSYGHQPYHSCTVVDTMSVAAVVVPQRLLRQGLKLIHGSLCFITFGDYLAHFVYQGAQKWL